MLFGLEGSLVFIVGLFVEISRMAEHFVSACLLLGEEEAEGNRALLNGNAYFISFSVEEGVGG